MGELLEQISELFLKIFHWGIDLREGKNKVIELKEEAAEIEHNVVQAKAHDAVSPHLQPNVQQNNISIDGNWANRVGTRASRQESLGHQAIHN